MALLISGLPQHVVGYLSAVFYVSVSSNLGGFSLCCKLADISADHDELPDEEYHNASSTLERFHSAKSEVSTSLLGPKEGYS